MGKWKKGNQWSLDGGRVIINALYTCPTEKNCRENPSEEKCGDGRLMTNMMPVASLSRMPTPAIITEDNYENSHHILSEMSSLTLKLFIGLISGYLAKSLWGLTRILSKWPELLWYVWCMWVLSDWYFHYGIVKTWMGGGVDLYHVWFVSGTLKRSDYYLKPL